MESKALLCFASCCISLIVIVAGQVSGGSLESIYCMKDTTLNKLSIPIDGTLKFPFRKDDEHGSAMHCQWELSLAGNGSGFLLLESSTGASIPNLTFSHRRNGTVTFKGHWNDSRRYKAIRMLKNDALTIRLDSATAMRMNTSQYLLASTVNASCGNSSDPRCYALVRPAGNNMSADQFNGLLAEAAAQFDISRQLQMVSETAVKLMALRHLSEITAVLGMQFCRDILMYQSCTSDSGGCKWLSIHGSLASNITWDPIDSSNGSYVALVVKKAEGGLPVAAVLRRIGFDEAAQLPVLLWFSMLSSNRSGWVAKLDCEVKPGDPGGSWSTIAIVASSIIGVLLALALPLILLILFLLKRRRANTNSNGVYSTLLKCH